jgi:Adenylylsulphate kinase
MTSVRREISREARTRRYGHHGAIIWLTGLSGAGRSTLASGTEMRVFDAGYAGEVSDFTGVSSPYLIASVPLRSGASASRLQ